MTPSSPQTGRWIQIRSLASPVPDYALQMTELEVFADVPASEVNRAIGSVATANQPVWPGTSPANLINGNRFDFVHGIADLLPGFAYTINLGIEIDISKIIIIPRQDGCCGERLSNYRVSVLDDNNGSPGERVWSVDLHTDFSDIGAEPGAAEVITGDLDASGQFKGNWIRIESLDDPVPNYALQIAEVEVYGASAGGVALLLARDLADIAVGLGQPAILSVAVNVVNGDTNLLSFQWQQDGVDISGATNSTFTTGPVLSSDSGKKFRVVVSYPGLPDLVSSEATLRPNYAYRADAFSNRILWTGAGWTIDKLVNGDRFDVFHGDVGIEPGFAYQVKLAAPVRFEQIDIYPRQDGCCPERLSNFRVSVHNDNNGEIGEEVWAADLFTDGANPGAASGAVVRLTKDLDLTGTFEGQWIQILSLDDFVPDYGLQMTELEAFGELLDPATRLSIASFPDALPGAPGRSSTITVSPNLFNGDPALLTYQWKKNGVVIPGATDSTYATGPLSDSDSGARYTVLLSYPGIPAVESPEATVQFDYNYARGAAAFSNRPLWPPGGWNISMLIDGDRRGVFHGDTAIAAGLAYTVNLGGTINLEKIDIYPRQDGCCPERLSNFRVSVHQDDSGNLGAAVWSADLFTDGSNPGSGPGTLVTITPDLDPGGTFKGQWIKIEALSDPVPDYFLQMTELEAIGRIEAPLSLNISLVQKQPSITWVQGTLEQVSSLGDPWAVVVGATSPYTVPAGEPRRYYRLSR